MSMETEAHDLKCGWVHSPGVPTLQGRESKEESGALGEGGEEHGRDFPALPLQHLPPLPTPPAPPGCESKQTRPCAAPRRAGVRRSLQEG